MRTTTKTTNTNNEKEVKKDNLKEAFVLWKTTAKTGLNYLTGKTTEEKPTYLKGFYNTNKKNPNEPDVRIYVTGEDNKDVEVASLWENIGKKDVKYFSGKTNEDEKLIGFYEVNKTEKQPDIKVYYKD